MAVDMFLKLDGVKGESHDDKHKGEIDILSFSWGASQLSTEPAGSGKASVHDFSIGHVLDLASPKLALACATGQHIPTGLLTVRKAGKTPVEFLKITMTDVLVSSFSWGESHGTAPTDQFSLNFSKIQITYKPQRPDGTLGTAETVVILNPDRPQG
jgi:type VI secretion system secreted protein Hcp